MGTTISILQAYPLGTLEAAEDYKPGEPYVTSIVEGLTDKGFGQTSVSVFQEDSQSRYFLDPARLTPLLRSFADLCTPLEDGTVPAVSLIESFGYAVKEYDEESKEEEAAILTTDGFITADGYNGQGFELMPDGVLLVWNKNPQKSYATHNAADWLRGKGYAVGLSADQYIRKEA